MPTYSRLILWSMALLVLLSVGVTFWKTMVVRDFEVIDDVDLESEESMEEM